MFGHWLFVRIRAGERALQEGRLDEAFAVAAQPDVRNHRRAQSLCDGLVKPLLARARLALQAGRYQAALEDLDRLVVIGRAGPEVENLRQRVEAQMQGRARRAAERERDIEQAAARLRAGGLETGRLLVERLEDTRRREALRDQLDVRVQRAGELLAQAEKALQAGDVWSAVRFWHEAQARHGRTQAGEALAVRLAPELCSALEAWFAEGRLDRLSAADWLDALKGWDPSLREFEQLATLAQRATRQLGRREYPELRTTLLRLKAARPGTAWVEAALEAVQRITEGHEALLASPLGLYASQAGKGGVSGAEVPVEPEARGEARRIVTAASEPVRAASTERRALLLLIDGAGSHLLVSEDCVRIGRAGGSRPVDVPIPGDLRSHHADIDRVGSDYFLTAYGPVWVNHRQVQRTLLRDGDRVRLGERVKFVFSRPSLKSDTAVLRLSHRSRLAQDVGTVVLFRETCLIGPQPSCHVRTSDGTTQVVVFERDGRLYAREAAAGGGKLGDAKPLPLEQALDFSELRLTLLAFRASG